jgi:nucleotide-binding universal stress UspA family protein
MIDPGRRVIVGVDDTDNSVVALDAAAAEAALRRRPLHVIHADPFATAASTTTGPLPDEPGRWVTRAMERAAATHPGLTVTGEVARGFPQPVLVEASRDAELVVIGDRGLGALARALVETVAGGLTVRAACPVLVTRGLGDPAGAIAVGVDGSPYSEAAVGFAFAEADLRAHRLTLVHAWSLPGPRKPGAVLPIDLDATSVRAGAERMMAEVSAGWREKYPGVRARNLLVHGHPREALTEVGQAESLIVVGTRGRTVPEVPQLGSVSRHLLYHAPCPIVVVPRHRAER